MGSVHDHRRRGLADFPRRGERRGEPATDPGHHHAGPRQVRAARRSDGHLATGRTRLTWVLPRHPRPSVGGLCGGRLGRAGRRRGSAPPPPPGTPVHTPPPLPPSPPPPPPHPPP